MSKYKLSPIEVLQLEKKRLKEERDMTGKHLSYRLQYLNDNWGSMVSKSLTDAVKTKVTDTVDNITYKSPIAIPFLGRYANNTLPNLILSNLPEIGGIVWRFAKPAIISWAAKKLLSSMFGRGKKR